MLSDAVTELVHIPVGPVTIEGTLVIPAGAPGVVLFAHGSGSSRQSPRNTFVAEVLQRAGLGTLLMALLSQEEDVSYETCCDICRCARRLPQAGHHFGIGDL